ncbi:hypothetical protein [Enterococcus faecalis]|uniref:hypothetical protein n=1 Tax=Enterococcus faecalis TaxID=1351 RepID=UPI001A96B927|nr:hypothetical protein [Enterococcus faecalis]MBO1135290.1 hypothetical protein [Enterococcus faecalis]
MLTEELERDIEDFINDCFGREITIYQALQLADAYSYFSLHYAMQEDDDITQIVVQRYFERLEKERSLEFYELT